MMKKIEAFIKKYHMIQENDIVVTGVSGGADSICLLFALLELKKALDFHIVVCHINHGIREVSADRDEQFVRKICEEKGLTFRVFHKNVELIAIKRKQSLEEAGRMVRREAFEKVLKEVNGTKIATAHHQNDNAETLLMNLARGSGLRGMCGITPVNGIWIRPLLCVKRSQIEEWMERYKIPFCQDETNEEDLYTRNRVRHRIIPELETQVNPQTVKHLYEASVQVQEVWEYIAAQTKKAYADCVQEQKQEGLLIYKEKFDALPDVLKKFLIKSTLENIAKASKDVTSAHISAVLDLLEGQVGRRINLPYHITAKRVYAGVLVESKKGKKQLNLEEKLSPRELLISGEIVIPERNLKVSCKVFKKKADFSFSLIPQKTYTKWFDYDIIKNSLLIRTRQQGDRIVIDKKGSTQKLKNYLINEKVPEEKRGSLLLIADGQQIIWIPGMRQSHAYQVKEETKRILEIRITEEKTDVRDDPGVNI
ncbi:tRNA lysidine(34) synthetase TilS [Mediterraneibacter sp. NSJ-55]|uniref:tRNA(Ile)-lysidine synthase n=1 Tax=Mediterraneibacter hominis TaxID=2763054 RepID=A0A923LJC2_9FIRM|nr:tRNA lysidine(34) synthetase TilS [Mediterraneibacter hominis]MBC5689902.1 tRNA lysidine(34) synthetase TilS [Mediterraneibacter hominis]